VSLGRSDDECELPDRRRDQSGPSVGFPIKDDLDTTGVINLALAVLSFTDIKAEDDLLADATRQAGRLDQWIEQMSGGLLRIDWQIVESPVELPFPSTDVPVVKRSPRYVEQALAATDALVAGVDDVIDFTDTDLLILVPPRSIESIDTDISFINVAAPSNEGIVPRVFASGAYFYTPGYYDHDVYDSDKDRLWGFWAHEMMHAFGLSGHAPDSYLVTGGGDPRADLHIGSTEGALSMVLSTWDRFLLGWLSEPELVCLTVDDLPIDVTLDSVEGGTSGYPVSIIVRLSETDAIVVESKRPVGFGRDFEPSTGGVIAYRVDTTIENDRNGDTGDGRLGARFAWYLEPSNPTSALLPEAGIDPLLRFGGTASSDGVHIEVIEFSKRDTVRLTLTG
jgi:M6 family metalloprotease-like protein